MIQTKRDKIQIATKSERIVHGGRGDYMEIRPEDVELDNLRVPINQQWRQTPRWMDKVYYFWYETNDSVKLYYQRKRVGYADYKIGYWYVDPKLVEEV